MVSIITHILTAFGLASASGLNAYIPLLIVALTARFTHLITLGPPFDILTHDWVIGALVVSITSWLAASSSKPHASSASRRVGCC